MRKAYIILSVLVLTIAACKKNNDISAGANNNNNNNNNNITNSPDSTMLATYFEMDTTITSGQDTLNKSEYSYDNDKRVVALRTYYYGSLPAGSLKCTNSFFYNGNNTLPDLRIDDYTGVGIPHPHRDSVFLFYDATGRLVLDSVMQYYPTIPTQPQITSYKYDYTFDASSGMYAVDIVRTYYYAGPQILVDHSDYSFNGNGDLEISMVQNAQFVYPFPQQYAFNYDSHPNPFHVKGCRDLSPFQDYSGEPFLYDYYGMSFSLASLSTYNVTTIDHLYGDGAVNHHDQYSRAYTYRSDGYPTSLTYYINNTGAPVYQKKGFYYYNH